MSEIVMLLCELKIGQRGQVNSKIQLKESLQSLSSSRHKVVI